jgi:hypothetical protein
VKPYTRGDLLINWQSVCEFGQVVEDTDAARQWVIDQLLNIQRDLLLIGDSLPPEDRGMRLPEPCRGLIGWCPRIPWCLDRCLLGDT